MEEFKYFRHSDSSGYYQVSQLENGQTIKIVFDRTYTKKRTEYFIILVIANKKRHIKQWFLGERDILSLNQTGRCGLEGLLWAKKQIESFEKLLREKDEKFFLYLQWSDNRRRNVYVRGLKSLNYIIGTRYGCKCLYKEIN